MSVSTLSSGKAAKWWQAVKEAIIKIPLDLDTRHMEMEPTDSDWRMRTVRTGPDRTFLIINPTAGCVVRTRARSPLPGGRTDGRRRR